MYYAVFSAGTNPEVSKETPKALSYATFFALQSAHLSFIQFCSSVNRQGPSSLIICMPADFARAVRQDETLYTSKGLLSDVCGTGCHIDYRNCS